MFGQLILSNGGYNMGLEKVFWNGLFVILASLGVIFFIVDFFFLKKSKKHQIYQNKLINILLIVGLILLVLWLVKNLSLYIFLQTIADKILYICVLSLATTGIVLIFKTSYTTNFAQGMIATFGAFSGGKMIVYLAGNYIENTLVLILLGMLTSAIIGFLLGISIDKFIIRKAKHVTSIGKQMITMGLVLVLSGLMPLIFGIIPIEIPRFSYEKLKITLPNMPQISLSYQAIYALVITVIILVILFSMLRFTKWGLGVRATASNEIVAGMMGVNTKMITAMSWAIAGALGGIAAVFYAPSGGQVTVGLMVSTQVNGFMAAILGGFSSFGGPLVGAAMIPLLNGLLSYFSFLWQNAIVYAIILLVVLVKPLGLFGKRIAKKV